MMRTGKMVLVGLGVSVLALGACGGTQIPQHSGYKSNKAKPWNKPKTIKLNDDYKGKISAELDYAAFKRARWFAVDLPGPGTLDVNIEVIPGGPERDDDEQMDVGLEILDQKFNVLAKSDLEADDARELKKERSLKELPEGRYLIHMYLEGRLDAADVDLKVAFTKGDLPWQSDFPNQVAFVGPLPAVPVLDDTPAPPKKPVRTHGTRHGPRPPRPPPQDPPPTTPTAGNVVVAITDVQASGSGAQIVIGGGTSDGLSNGLVGSVRGVRNSTFKLTGCSSSTCKATVKASPDDVRGSGKVSIRLVIAP